MMKCSSVTIIYIWIDIQCLCNFYICSQWFSSVSANDSSIDFSVENVLANQATLVVNSTYVHCYDITCSIRHISSGKEDHVHLDHNSQRHNISNLAPNTEYKVVCTAEGQSDIVSDEVVFITKRKWQDCASAMCKLPATILQNRMYPFPDFQAI